MGFWSSLDLFGKRKRFLEAEVVRIRKEGEKEVERVRREGRKSIAEAEYRVRVAEANAAEMRRLSEQARTENNREWATRSARMTVSPTPPSTSGSSPSSSIRSGASGSVRSGMREALGSQDRSSPYYENPTAFMMATTIAASNHDEDSRRSAYCAPAPVETPSSSYCTPSYSAPAETSSTNSCSGGSSDGGGGGGGGGGGD